MKRIVSILVSAVLLLTGCDRRELTYEYDTRVRLQVVFDWQNAPAATPENMSFHLFPKGGGEGQRYDFSDRNGGVIRIPEGVYDMFCYNSDSEVAMYRHTDRWETFEVSTHNASGMQLFSSISSGLAFSRGEGTDGQRVVFSPDSLWRAGLGDFVVSHTEGDARVTLVLQSAVQTYRVLIRNVKNLPYASGVSATISSMSGGVRVSDGSLSDDAVTISFGMEVNLDASSMEGAFSTFGHCASSENTHLLTLAVLLQDGTEAVYTFDVTEKLHELDETGDRLLVIDGLELPHPPPLPPEPEDSGVSAETDRWTSVDVEISL